MRLILALQKKTEKASQKRLESWVLQIKLCESPLQTWIEKERDRDFIEYTFGREY